MWNNFESSSSDEETINNVFCTNGLFKILGEELHGYPNVQSILQNKKMIIAADKTLILLENENIAECSFLNFSSNIDSIAISNSGSIIVCGLQDGNVHGVFIKGFPIFNLCIEDKDVGKHQTFTDIKRINDTFYIACANGSIYRLSNLEEENFLKTYTDRSLLENETCCFDETILKNVMLERVVEKSVPDQITAFTVLNDIEHQNEYNKNSASIFATTRHINFNQGNESIKIRVPEVYQGIKKIFDLENFVLGLSNSGHLFEICPVSHLIFTPYEVENCLIDDIIVMENNENDVELLILTKPDADNVRYMRIVSFPDMETSYEMEMNEHTWLVKQPKTSVNIYYLSGENCNEKGHPQAIEVRIICETQPEQRLKKLILRGHLEEAEEFGRQFELDLEPIYEAKARKLLVDINNSCETDEKRLNEKFHNFLNVLKLIKNKNFLLAICNFEMPNRKIYAVFLKIILGRIESENDESILEIKEQILRLETLDLIDPHHCDMDWVKFVRHPNMIKICVSYFKRDILIACLIWKRHISCIMPFLDVKNIERILNAVPSSTEPFNVVQLLKNIVPNVLQSIPEVTGFLVDWSIQKTRSLQYEKHWPDIGLEFATNILTIFKDVKFLYSDVRRQYESNIEKLNSIVHVLQDLSVLKTSYNLIITMDNYMKESPQDTALHILQRIQLTNLTKCINDFLYPIFLEKGRSPVEAIKKYITFLINNRNSVSSWLDRAIACINLLYNEEEKLQSALLVLKATPVPWPEIVMPLAKLSDSTHPLAVEIRAEYDLQSIKIIRKKYGWPVDATDNNIKLISRILKLNLPDMTNDIKNLIKASPEISGKASFLCCSELSKKGEIEKAISFLESLDGSLLKDCCEKILHIVPHILEDPQTTETEVGYLIEFLKLVSERSGKVDKSILRNIENKQFLRREYNFNGDIENVSSTEREILLQKCVEMILEKFRARKTNLVNFLWRSITKLSDALDMSHYKGLLDVLEKVNNLHLSCAFAYNIVQSTCIRNEDVECFVQIALLIILQQSKLELSHDDVDPLSFPLVFSLLTKCLERKTILDHQILELLTWVRIGSSLYDINCVHDYYKNFTAVETNVFNAIASQTNEVNGFQDPNEMKDFGSMSFFEDADHLKEDIKPKTNGQPVLDCLSNAFELVFNVICPPSDQHSIFNCFLTSAEITANEHKIKFCKSLETLVKLRQHKSWYKILQIVMKYQVDFNIAVIDGNYIASHCRKIFRHSLSEEDPDFIDLFGMLLLHPAPSTCLDFLNNELKYGQARLNYFILSNMYFDHIRDDENLSKDKENQLKFHYFMELCKLEPNLKGKTATEFLTVNQLVKELRKRILPVKLLDKISLDFNIDRQHVITSQIVTILQKQKPVIEIKVDELGKDEVIVKTTVEQMLELCMPYVTEITNTNHLAEKLIQFMDEINFYFYELYLTVIEILIYVGKLRNEMEIWKSILLFLKHKMTTKRRNKPSQIEIDWWLKSHVDMGVLPKIAKYRLPFKPLIDEPLKNILDNEVSVDNCISWFPLIKLHSTLLGVTSTSEIVQKQEYFCMSSVKNSISEYRQQHDEVVTDSWHLKPTNNAFLQAILRLVNQMHDPSKILFILYFVTNHAPEGADQVEAAYECYKFAIQNEHQLTAQKALETVSKIKRKYPIYRTQHLLHVYNLADDKLLHLVENPREIINALYHHEIVLQYEKPNINLVAMEIAKLHSLDPYIIQLNLLQKWLGLTTDLETISTEDTFIEGLNTSISAVDGIGDEYVARAHYIFTSWDTEKAIQFLIGQIYPVDGNINTSKQMILFECFIRLLDDPNNLTTDIVNQKQYIVLKCVNHLKQLGYNLSVEKFNEYDKLTVLKKVWQNHANNSNALVVMTYICLGFGIEVPQIWNGILKQMVKLNMLDELNAIVDLISCKIKLLHTDGLKAAWQYILSMPFKTASRTRNEEQEENLLKNLFRIQGCPVIADLNLKEIAETCIRLERPHMAAVLLGLAKGEQRSHIKTIVLKYKSPTLKQEILELEEFGILPIIVNNVTQELGI